MNLYSFVMNNSANAIDPDGRFLFLSLLMGETTEKHMQGTAGMVYAKILNQIGYMTAAGIYGVMRLGQWTASTALSTGQYLAAQSVAATRYASEAAQTAYLRATAYFIENPSRMYESANLITGYGISGPPSGSAASMLGHAWSMKNEYSVQINAAFDAFLDYVADPETQ